MIKILINNCGSQVKEIASLLHEGDVNISYVCANYTNDLDSVIDNYLGKDMDKSTSIKDYIRFIIELCKKNGITIFLPFRRMEELVDYKYIFTEMGISMIIPDDAEMFHKLNDKAQTYEYLGEIIPECVPEYYTVNTLDELKQKVEYIRGQGKDVCVKYVNDISSNSFRILRFEKHTLKELDQKTEKQKSRLSHEINYSDLLDMLDNNELPKSMIVMEYLADEEVSCDCLKTPAGNIIVPRIKLNRKTQMAAQQKDIMNICNKILNFIDYDTPCNIQFKYNNSTPMLLEINTRMSGGIMIASWASNVNLPLIAVKQAAGEYITELPEWKNVKMVQKNEFEKYNLD